MKLVFLKQGDLQERSWLEYLLEEVIESSSVQEPWPEPQPHTIYALSSNTLPLASIPSDFLAGVKRVGGVGLVHIADEWLSGRYAAYRSFDFVLRNYWQPSLQKPGILTIPLGFPGGTVVPEATLPASRRSHTWMFFGNMIASRVEMMRAFASVPRGCEAHGSRVDHAEFCRLMGDTVFIPAPMGNVVAETWRLYEALEYGCIPVIETRLTLDYYKELLGAHPLPAFRSWQHAAEFVRSLLSNPEDLDALQAEVEKWWSLKKRALIDQVSAFVTAGASGALRADLERLTLLPAPIGVARQYMELARHQTLESFLLLVRKVLRRGSVKLPF